jgi:hypothetical protein
VFLFGVLNALFDLAPDREILFVLALDAERKLGTGRRRQLDIDPVHPHGGGFDIGIVQPGHDTDQSTDFVL